MTVCRQTVEVIRRSVFIRATSTGSAFPVKVGGLRLADGILDRSVHDAHRIEMRGDSMLQE